MVPIGIVVIVVVAAVVLVALVSILVARSTGEKSTMKKTSLEAYALFVCLVSLAVLAISASTLAYDVVQIANPSLTLSSTEFRKHQTNDAFWESGQTYYMEGKREERKRPSEDELTKRRTESFAVALAEEQHDAKQSLVSSLIAIIISAVILLLHWKLAKNSRNSGA
jgi:hypothetical protein